MEIAREIQAVNMTLTQEQLREYIEKVNNLLENMNPGDSIHVKRIPRPETRDVFLESIKAYMRSKEWQDGLCFDKGFEILRKYDVSKLGSKKTP